MAVLIMAQQSKTDNANNNNTTHNLIININNTTTTQQQQQQLEVKQMFHDFLGMKPTPDSPILLAPKKADASPSASVSIGASSGGGRAPLSSTSDLASGQSCS